ncbi:MAG TPA: MarR family transcriptional regulator [Fimbriimonas sp.]|nr:MarR family transcriptional regulator [Fimbriimonas sp.]
MVKKEDYVALATFRRNLRRFLRFAEEGAREVGLTPQQHQVLLAIKGRPDREWASVGELADSLQLKHHATVGLVDRCQAAGLVERTPDQTDRRVVHVSLTEKGEDTLRKLTERNLPELRALGKLTSELEALARR